MEPRVAFCRNRNGQRLAYMTWGEGPLLVVPPGWISHLELQWHYLGMEDLYGRLVGSFRLLVYDRRGAGLSERARDDFTLEAELADLEAVIDEAAPEGEVSLLGISQAGPLAIAYAAAHPERVRRLVLFGAYDRGELLAPAQVRASVVALVRASWGIGSHALASIFVPEADPVFLAKLARFQREAADKEMAAALLESGYGYDVREAMAAVRAPTLVIHRRGDRATKSHFGVDLAAGVPGARLVMLEGDIHFPWLGEWETVAELVEDFVLDRAGPKAERPRKAHVPREPPMTRHQLVHYRVGTEPEQPSGRIALAQIGEAADLPIPAPSGLYRLPEARVKPVADKLRACVERAAEGGAELVVFPEMSIDLNHPLLEERAYELAREHRMLLVLGGYHDETTRTNVCVVLGPDGLLWKQRKHIPAFLRAGMDWIAEPIEPPPSPLYIVGATKLGRVTIAICRDFLDLELRVALKNSAVTVPQLWGCQNIQTADDGVTTVAIFEHGRARMVRFHGVP